jgi:putative Mg2+ transporter-C (MgtC) family protein
MTGELFGWATLAARLGVALLAGAVIGWDRQRLGKAAGMRTHMLVSLGAAVLVLVPLGLGAGGDAVSRAIQGVATGVGFLGAGEILHHLRQDGGKATVKGLTSAAATWLTAALGIAAGCGLWRTLALASGATMLILTLVKPLERALFRKPHEDPAS